MVDLDKISFLISILTALHLLQIIALLGYLNPSLKTKPKRFIIFFMLIMEIALLAVLTQLGSSTNFSVSSGSLALLGLNA